MKKNTLFLLLTLSFSIISRAQTVDEVIENYLKAIGGKEKLLSLKTLRTTGFLKMQGMEIPYIQQQKAPNLQRSVALFLAGFSACFKFRIDLVQLFEADIIKL